MKVTVFYDGACPICLRALAKWRGQPYTCDIEWFDITGQDDVLLTLGISPQKAVEQLHILCEDGTILTSMSSYSFLLRHLPHWRLLGILISLPGVRQCLTRGYDAMTRRRLKKEGRYCNTKDG
ncbi:thiol-disulfide oxidoreductase DCC family protein [Endozoicomonas sp.]|uniref:thiol-disulfide oxidoreductase DCC family protein n=1 Tax=Endozoicomonas sp. TaxID=1892382 RepID=UPI00383B3B0B